MSIAAPKNINKTYQAIISALPAQFNTLLDVCCGDGKLISLISEKYQASFTGIDEDREKVAVARERNIPNAEFFVCKPTCLYFKDGSLDVVISPLPLFTYNEILRVLSPHGGVFITPVNHNTARGKVKELKKLGFSDVFLKKELLIAIK